METVKDGSPIGLEGQQARPEPSSLESLPLAPISMLWCTRIYRTLCFRNSFRISDSIHSAPFTSFSGLRRSGCSLPHVDSRGGAVRRERGSKRGEREASSRDELKRTDTHPVYKCLKVRKLRKIGGFNPRIAISRSPC